MSGMVRSIITSGFEGFVIETECHLSNGLPGVIVVGLGNKAVDEAKERIRSAFARCMATLPKKRITINLAPADLPKDSASLDLPIAVAILAESQQIKHAPGPQDAFIGELGLDGTIRPGRGIVGKLLAGKKQGLQRFFIPKGNFQQATLIPGITLIPLETLEQLYLGLSDQKKLAEYRSDEVNQQIVTAALPFSQFSSLSEISGQEQAKRAIIIAAAGGHNILLNGPPGTGKSMLAKSLIGLLPGLTKEEMLEVTHLHSLSGTNYDQLVTSRPFRSPHHSASHVAVTGGGHSLRPGEISLSHRGVLFFDELPEFNRQTLESLRQPLEERTITISRAKDVATYPADFIFVATANPCPCGYFGTDKICQCRPHTILQYRQKLSGPIIDRIDLYVNVQKVEHERLLRDEANTKADDEAQQQVLRARKVQQTRFQSSTLLNAGMSNRQIKQDSQLETAATALLNQAAQTFDISARSYMKIIKVARTIADLENSATILPEHMSEALQYRRPQQEFMT